MKKKLLISMLCLLMAFTLISCGGKKDAMPKASEGLEFIMNEDGTCYVAGMGSCTDTTVVVPATAPNGAKVVGVGDRAFKDEIYLIEVILPEGIKTIGNYAFSSYHGKIKNMAIPNSVEAIGKTAFSGQDVLCEKEYGVYYIDNWVVGCNHQATSLTLREGVVGVAVDAFWQHDTLTSVFIPNTAKYIYAIAFHDCEKLTDITFDGTMAQWNGIHKIGGWDQKWLPKCTIHCTDGDISIGE